MPTGSKWRFFLPPQLAYGEQHFSAQIGPNSSFFFSSRIRHTSSTRDWSSDVCSSDLDRLQEHGAIDWTGKRVLEVGPGSDLSTGAVILARGAESYRAVDLFDNRAQADPALYGELGRRLGAPVDLARLQFTLATFPGLREVDGAYDLIVSNATLEHVEDVGGLFASLRRLAAPGARMVHH